MEKRQHARISIPLIVEIKHAAIGEVETRARDISEGGVFVFLDEANLSKAGIKPGASVRIRLHSELISSAQYAPTVDATINRIETDGLALSFRNKTAEHLWSSVERLRDELFIGQDFFQIYQVLVCQHADKGLLFVQRDGKWQFPGYYLKVGQSLSQSHDQYLSDNLTINQVTGYSVIATESFHHELLPEAATYATATLAEVADFRIQLADQSGFRNDRWVNKTKELNDMTVSHEWFRALANQLLQKNA